MRLFAAPSDCAGISESSRKMKRIGPTSAELLGAADDLLSEASEASAGRWPRAVAILCRQAVEGSLHDFWRAKAPGLEGASERAQLLCVRSYVAPELAARVEHAWTALSRACHHHGYELSPTASELAGWFEVADELDRVVRRRIEAPSR